MREKKNVRTEVAFDLLRLDVFCLGFFVLSLICETLTLGTYFSGRVVLLENVLRCVYKY